MATKIVRTHVGAYAYFGVHTDLRPVAKYRWQKDGVDIPGAGSDAAYKTPPLRTEDLKSKWRCIVYQADGLNEISEEVGLSDAPPAEPPPQPAPVEDKKKDSNPNDVEETS